MKTELDNSIIKDIHNLTQANNHTEARLVLSSMVKRKDLFECYASITQLQNYFKHLPYGLNNVRDELDVALFNSVENNFSNFKKIQDVF